MPRGRRLPSIAGCVFFCMVPLWAQVAGKTPAPADPSALAQQAITLTEQGKCKEALAALKNALPRLTDKQLPYQASMAEARCAMALEQSDAAIQALLRLKREFPKDPEILFIIGALLL
jgi:predicted Zn-dependent protease